MFIGQGVVIVKVDCSFWQIQSISSCTCTSPDDTRYDFCSERRFFLLLSPGSGGSFLSKSKASSAGLFNLNPYALLCLVLEFSPKLAESEGIL